MVQFDGICKFRPVRSIDSICLSFIQYFLSIFLNNIFNFLSILTIKFCHILEHIINWVKCNGKLINFRLNLFLHIPKIIVNLKHKILSLLMDEARRTVFINVRNIFMQILEI